MNWWRAARSRLTNDSAVRSKFSKAGPAAFHPSEFRLDFAVQQGIDCLRPEKQIAQKQLQLRKEKLCALAGAIAQSLSAEDKLLIKMHFVSGHKISEIGRLLGKEDRLLYTRIQAILRNLRKAMEEAGTGGGEVQEVLCAMGGSDG